MTKAKLQLQGLPPRVILGVAREELRFMLKEGLYSNSNTT